MGMRCASSTRQSAPPQTSETLSYPRRRFSLSFIFLYAICPPLPLESTQVQLIPNPIIYHFSSPRLNLSRVLTVGWTGGRNGSYKAPATPSHSNVHTPNVHIQVVHSNHHSPPLTHHD